MWGVLFGRYPIGLGGDEEELLKTNASNLILYPPPKEGRMISTNNNFLYVFSNAPRPSATKIFINWLLSKDGQLVWSQETRFRSQSARNDVPTDALEADRIRREGVNYFNTINEEWLLSKPKFREWADEMFRQLPRIYLGPQGRITYSYETNRIE